MRIVRTFFFLAAAAILAPSPPDNEIVSLIEHGGQEPSAFQMASAAGQTFADLGSFCARQPGVCETAQYVAVRLEAKAKYGIRLLYNWANEASAGAGGLAHPTQADGADSLVTGSTLKLASTDGAPSPQNTLKLDDLIPEWRGPVPVKKG